jgi:aspartate beta-hydroxylase
VNKHHGPTNKKLRCHLPLKVPHDIKDKKESSSSSPSHCWLRVADQIVPIEEGKAVIFDDSFEHEAANEHPDQPRVVLVVDFWHPDFTDEEVIILIEIFINQLFDCYE